MRGRHDIWDLFGAVGRRLFPWMDRCGAATEHSRDRVSNLAEHIWIIVFLFLPNFDQVVETLPDSRLCFRCREAKELREEWLQGFDQIGLHRDV